jgi:hypothetical protein
MDDGLLEINKNTFREIFFKKIAEKDLRSITKKQFLKFVSNLRVYPELISSLDLKRVFTSVLKNKFGEKVREITFSKFEKLIKALARHCFPSGDSVRLLITHIKSSCLFHYQANLITKIQKEAILMSTQRLLSSNREKHLLKNTLDKTLSQKMSLSGFLSPRNQTQTRIETRLGEIKSPSLKIFTSSKKRSEKSEKIHNLKKIIEKFRVKHVALKVKSKTQKKIPLTFFVRKMFNNGGNVRFMQFWVKKLSFELWRVKSKTG